MKENEDLIQIEKVLSIIYQKMLAEELIIYAYLEQYEHERYLPSVVELLLLLGHPAVNLLTDLTQLQLTSQHLVLLGLECTLSLLKSRLELLLLDLEPPALFVQIVDGTTTISQLVKQILDLISQVLVLTTNNVQLLVGLIQGSLEAETFGVEVAALRVAGLQLTLDIVSLGLPFANNLLKVLATLSSDDSSGMSSLVFHGELLKLSLHAVLGLLIGGNLGVQTLNGFLSLGNSTGKLVSGTLKLLNSAETLSLELGLPELDLRLGLGESTKDIVLLLSLLINLHAQVLSLSVQGLEFGEQGSTVPGLTVSEPLGVLKLGGQRNLVLLQSSKGVLSLLNLSGEVLVFNLELLLAGISLIEGPGKLIKTLVVLNNESLSHLAVLLHVGALPHGLLKGSSGLLEISLHASLILLRLGLVLVDVINLFSKLRHAVVVLLSESSQSSLMGNVGLLKISLQLGKLSLTLLVQLNLGGCVGSSLRQSAAKVLQVTGQERPVLLSLGTVVALNDDLLIKLINPALELLDLLGVLRAKSLLILNLGRQTAKLLLLPLDSSVELSIHTLKVRDSLLGELKVSLNLALHLLNITLRLLLTLKGVLTFVKGLLQLALNLVEVVAPVFHGLDVLLNLLPALSNGLLVLGQLGDQILLVSNLIPEGSDLTVLGHLVLLTLLNGGFQVLDILTEPGGLSSHLGSRLLDSGNGLLLTLDSQLGLINLLLQVILGSLQAVGFVNDVLKI